MSLFDFPRINFQGIANLNPGTANNDDYAGAYSIPEGSPHGAGETLALMESKLVQAQTYGMSDDAFMAWAQKAQTFDAAAHPGSTQEIIPSEWNFYGGMGMSLSDAKVIGVQTGVDSIYTEVDSAVELTTLLGADVNYVNGHITDVNSEGSPPATQFFIDQLNITKGSSVFLNNSASKGTGQWLNFYRNVNLTADAGAAAYVYHVVKTDKGALVDLFSITSNKPVVGVVLRYYLYRALIEGGNERIEKIYEQQGVNPAPLQILGTLAPLYEDETIFTMPTGRLMISNETNIKTPTTNNNGGGNVALAPGILQYNGDTISADFIATFPDNYQSNNEQDATNPKFDFGKVSLMVAAGNQSETVGEIPYADTDTGDQQGYIFDFNIANNKNVKALLNNKDAYFYLQNETIGKVLTENDYYVVSNQLSIYAEQHGSETEFLNQGTLENASVSIYHRGIELTPENCPPTSLWVYRSIPLQSPGNIERLSASLKPGEPIKIETDQPGNFLFTFTVDTPTLTDADLPENYATFANPPYITNAPSISLRILPNNENFDKYYVDPTQKDPVGNELLTFEVLYEKVLRTYYLLFPAMIAAGCPMNSEARMRDMAGAILGLTQRSMWMNLQYMPRTRDISESRLKLLRAWCRKVTQY